MTIPIVTDELLGQVARRQHELFQRVKKGTIDAETALEGLQDIIEGRYVQGVFIKESPQEYRIGPPTWYVSPDRQLERVKAMNRERNWGFRDTQFPLVPESFVPLTSTEILMLAVYFPSSNEEDNGLNRTFDELWNAIGFIDGVEKVRSSDVVSEFGDLQLSGSSSWEPGVRWVAFDPNAYRLNSVDRALMAAKRGGISLAHVEVFMAAALFPEWILSWSDLSNPSPALSGLSARRQFYSLKWVDTLRLSLDLRIGELRLSRLPHYRSNVGRSQSSPTVRVL